MMHAPTTSALDMIEPLLEATFKYQFPFEKDE